VERAKPKIEWIARTEGIAQKIIGKAEKNKCCGTICPNFICIRYKLLNLSKNNKNV